MIDALKGLSGGQANTPAVLPTPYSAVHWPDMGSFTLTRAHNGGWTVTNKVGQLIGAYSSFSEFAEAFPKMVGEIVK